MTTPEQPSSFGQGALRDARTARLLWVAAGLVFVALIGVALWFVRRDVGVLEPARDQAATPLALGVRLTLATGAPGEDAAALVRVYNARARHAQAVQDATAAGREWKGTIDGPDATFVEARLGRDEWRASLTFEHVDETGTATAIPSDALSIVTAPEGDLSFGAADTHTLVVGIGADAVPPPGGRLRARLAHAVMAGVSNIATVAAAPSDPVALLARGARVAELMGRFDLLAQKATAIIAASATSPVGYWYRGVALEANGDRAGALDAYQAASDRVTPGGQEPPVGLDLRIARLRAR